MAMVSLTSPCNTNLPQSLSLENTNLRDASFSSYLSGAEGSFVIKLAESSQNLNSLITSPQEHLYVGKNKVEDGEIGVFGAEKYFNGGDEDKTSRIDNKSVVKPQYEEKDDTVDIAPVKTKQPPSTPSVRSESSWNSQSALLHAVQRKPPQRRKSFLASLACNCSCNDKDSVDIDEHVSANGSSSRRVSCGVVQGKATTKQPIEAAVDSVDLARMSKSRLDPWVKEFDELGPGLKRENGFSFPIVNAKTGNLSVKIPFPEGEADIPRKSLEVFGSPILEKRKKTSGLERRLTMMTWDAIPRVEETKIAATSDGMHSIAGSDSSSDLFEIESFSSSANPVLPRQASDDMSSCVTPTCYAPSEASIEWSVVTASAADFSVMSDSEELRTAANLNKTVQTAKAAASKEMQKKRPGLLGCKSQKAVTVANAYKTSERTIPDSRRCHRSDSFAQMTRFSGRDQADLL